MDLNSPVTALKGVGPSAAERLLRLHIRTLQDLLFHLPLRYQDRTRISPIGSLRPGWEVAIEGEVQLCEVRMGRRRSLLCRFSDGTGSLVLRFFHFSAAQQARLGQGSRLRCFGEVRRGPTMLEMVHPEYRQLQAGVEADVESHLTPVYPTTEGVNQQRLRALIGEALTLLQEGALEELLPQAFLPYPQWPTLTTAVSYLHRPPPDAPLDQLLQGEHPAQQRLIFEELLAHHLTMRRLRLKVERQVAPPMVVSGQLSRRFLQQLPFKLTPAQQRVVTEILQDLEQPHPMQRLVQGDVGSGKTVVAAAAVLHAVEAGFQVAVMAPTELLAEQHLQSFSAWLAPLEVSVVGLIGGKKNRARRELVAQLAAGEIAVAIGTHALFQRDVSFDRLGLIIVDEQHRFGVHQRLALREKGSSAVGYPHQLIMTATPIPRTLAMTAYADLDSSIIDELPPGRQPIETVVVSNERRAEVVQRVLKACQQGQQVYWVCTLIEESEVLQCQAALDSAEQLTEALPELQVALVHGRLKSAEKEALMGRFKAGEIDLLVATTVIEVGVDVPNATLMIVENAERLGLAQLHQLRGRVGRGSAKSACVLMYHKPLSEQARARLAVLRESSDGFEIARRDLEIRGPGEVLGTRQSGLLQLRIADLARDQALIPKVSKVAARLLQEHAERVPNLIERWIGDADRYGEV